MTKLQTLLKSRGQKGAVIMSEDELFKRFKDAGCSTKTDMIMNLHDAGYSNSDIAATLAKYGILKQSSSNAHTANTVDRVNANRATKKKTA